MMFPLAHPWIMGVGLAFMLVFWAGVVLFIIWAARALMSSSAMHSQAVQAPAAPRTPKEILDERLAKGEITPEDYERAKTALGGW